MSPSVIDRGAYHAVRFPFDPERAKVWRAICRYLQPWVDKLAPLLDLGAGYGEFSRFTEAAEKWALDMNPELEAYWPEEVRPIFQGATEPLPIGDCFLGTVFASNFFEHFTTDEGAAILGEVRRTLRPGGRFIAVQPNFRLEPRRYFDDYTHKTAYTDTGFTGLLRACGFQVVHSEPRFTPFTMQSRWPKAEWMVQLYLALPYRPLAGQFLVIAEKE
ncbi:MAG TPA: class I SAM-dependent methyltransferase [Bryobacteraceae bacterium]|nr:class I SAM-dependent methyltransferase [Bryobacteraceae bacterium]